VAPVVVDREDLVVPAARVALGLALGLAPEVREAQAQAPVVPDLVPDVPRFLRPRLRDLLSPMAPL
jgi:hypothetical protein